MGKNNQKELTLKLERVQKFIAFSGLCSRRKAEKLIEKEKVKVNGKIISLGDKCLQSDKIEVEGKQIKFNLDKLVYIILNKSSGFVTTNNDEFDRKTVFDFLDEKDRISNLFSIGRLDKYTSGLLLLTNDGQFAQNIIHPSKKISKEYIVELNKKLDINDKKILEKGIYLDGYKLKPCEIRKVTDKKYVIVIWEGRKRQIRRIFEEKGYLVTNLHRIKIGNLDLKEFNLNFREYKKVSKEFLEGKIFN